MNAAPGTKRWAQRLCLLSALATCQCDRKDAETPSPEEFARMKAQYDRLKAAESRPKPTTRPLAAPPSAVPRSAAAPPSASADAPSTNAPAPSAPASTAPEEAGPWHVDEPVDIAPAGPITATQDGVVLYNRDNRVFLARLGRLARGPRKGKTPVQRLAKPSGRFPLGRGPGVTEQAVYWISSGRLVRRSRGAAGRTGALEVLATDAQDGTRVAAPAGTPGAHRAKLPESVAYIVKPQKKDGPLRARLWVEGGPARSLTPEGSSTHSVSLVRDQNGLLAVALQARMAMTPIHSRRIRFAKQTPVVDEDVVVWVGGGVQSLTELALLPGRDDQLWGLLPHERSITEFGVAVLDISMQPDMNTPTSWIVYPNGLDPAPVDGARLCGEPIVIYAQPASPKPHATQELIARSVTETSRRQRLATAEAFFAVSAHEVAGGVLVAYVADWVSWAVTLRCAE